MTALQPIAGSQPLKLRIADVELLGRAGAFDRYRKIELIEGALFAMNAEYRRHNVVKNRLARLLGRALERIGSPLEAWTEGTLSLSDTNLPQPDVIVALGGLDERYYELRDLGFVIEVADSTVTSDRAVKRQLYAHFGVPEYWVVDLPAAQVHQYARPQGGDYTETRTVPLAGDLRSLTIADLAIDGAAMIR